MTKRCSLLLFCLAVTARAEVVVPAQGGGGAGSVTVNTFTNAFNTNQFLVTGGTNVSARDGILVTNLTSFSNLVAYGRANIQQITNPPSPSAVSGGAGSLSGNYAYRITYTTRFGETSPSGAAGPPELAAEQVTLTIPVATGNNYVTGRNVYRTVAEGSEYLFLTNIANNTATSLSDNFTDAALKWPVHSINSAGAVLYVSDRHTLFFDPETHNLFIGTNAVSTNLVGSQNIFIGGGGRWLTNGDGNVSIGYDALKSISVGSGNFAGHAGALRFLTNGNFNVAIGQDALGVMTNGTANLGLGRDSLFNLLRGTYNVSLGDFTAESLLTGSNNVFLGAQAGPRLGGSTTPTDLNNVILLGYRSFAPSNNIAVIGGSSGGGNIERVFLGNGVTNATPVRVAVHATSGLGTDVAGGGLDLAGGQGTGTGAGGPIRLQVAGVGVSSATLNALATVATISPSEVLITATDAENGPLRPRLVLTNTSTSQSIEFNASGISARAQTAIQFNWGDASTGWGTNLLNLSPGGGLTPAIARNLQLGTLTSPYVRASSVDYILSPTNAQAVVLRAANSNSVPVTNVVGLVEMGSASPMIIDCNLAHNVTCTNRVTGVVTIVWTNTAPGQTYSLTIPGEISGGTSRAITLVPTLGNLVANLSVFGTALATSGSFTLTNGNAAQIDVRMSRYHAAGAASTNIFGFTVRQYAF